MSTAIYFGWCVISCVVSFLTRESRKGRRIGNILDGELETRLCQLRVLAPLSSASFSLPLSGESGSVHSAAICWTRCNSGFWYWILDRRHRRRRAIGRASIKMKTNEAGRNEVLRWGRTRSLIYSPSTRYGLALLISFFLSQRSVLSTGLSRPLFLRPFFLYLQLAETSASSRIRQGKIQFSRAQTYPQWILFIYEFFAVLFIFNKNIESLSDNFNITNTSKFTDL